jgi:hypothetical protein
MEEITGTIGTVPAAGLAILTTAVLLVKDMFKLFSSWLEKELAFKQAARHDKLKIEADLYIESKKEELSRNKQLRDKQLQDTLGANLLEDALKVQNMLKTIKEKTDARNVTITAYHNGVAKGFRNFSIRYEETRESKYSIIDNYQSKPLSARYKAIKQFETKDYCWIRENDEPTDETRDSLGYMKMNEVLNLITIPLMIAADTLQVSEQGVMPIKKDGVDYYILGVLKVHLDKDSKTFTELELTSYLENRVDDIMNLYNKNNKILG